MAHTVVFEYVTAENGTIHLARQDAMYPFTLAKTLCGRSIGGWEMGDETISGAVASCRRCRTLRHQQKEAT